MAEERLLDYVKFEFYNTHGAKLQPCWITVLTEDDEAQVLEKAQIGRPYLTRLTVLDRIGMPEDVRHHPGHMSAESRVEATGGRWLDGDQFVEAVRERLA